MATKAISAEEIVLHDDKAYTLRPLTIANMREFMKMLEEVQAKVAAVEVAAAEYDAAVRAAEENGTEPPAEKVEGLDELGLLGLFIPCAVFCFNANRKDEDNVSLEWFEDNVDLLTVQEIVRVCGGVELGNPQATSQPSPLGRR